MIKAEKIISIIDSVNEKGLSLIEAVVEFVGSNELYKKELTSQQTSEVIRGNAECDRKDLNKISPEELMKRDKDRRVKQEYEDFLTFKERKASLNGRDERIIRRLEETAELIPSNATMKLYDCSLIRDLCGKNNIFSIQWYSFLYGYMQGRNISRKIKTKVGGLFHD